MLAFYSPVFIYLLHQQHNKKTPGMDINVTGIWEHNITGSGIIVAVIDDGKSSLLINAGLKLLGRGVQGQLTLIFFVPHPIRKQQNKA